MKAKKSHIDEKFFLLLSQNYSLCRKFAENELRSAGITLAEYSFLRVLENKPEITANEAGKKLGSTPPSISQLVRSLSQKGLIKRKTDTDDTRRQPMLLTSKGSSVIRNARKSIDASLQKLMIPKNVFESLVINLTTFFTSLSSYVS